MNTAEVARSAARLRAAIAIAASTNGPKRSAETDDALVAEIAEAGLDLVFGLCANIAAIRERLDAKADDLKGEWRDLPEADLPD